MSKHSCIGVHCTGDGRKSFPLWNSGAVTWIRWNHFSVKQGSLCCSSAETRDRQHTYAWPRAQCRRWRCRWWAGRGTWWTGRSIGSSSCLRSSPPMDSGGRSDLRTERGRKVSQVSLEAGALSHANRFGCFVKWFDVRAVVKRSRETRGCSKSSGACLQRLWRAGVCWPAEPRRCASEASTRHRYSNLCEAACSIWGSNTTIVQDRVDKTLKSP